MFDDLYSAMKYVFYILLYEIMYYKKYFFFFYLIFPTIILILLINYDLWVKTIYMYVSR